MNHSQWCGLEIYDFADCSQSHVRSCYYFFRDSFNTMKYSIVVILADIDTEVLTVLIQKIS